MKKLIILLLLTSGALANTIEERYLIAFNEGACTSRIIGNDNFIEQNYIEVVFGNDPTGIPYGYVLTSSQIKSLVGMVFKSREDMLQYLNTINELSLIKRPTTPKVNYNLFGLGNLNIGIKLTQNQWDIINGIIITTVSIVESGVTVQISPTSVSVSVPLE